MRTIVGFLFLTAIYSCKMEEKEILSSRENTVKINELIDNWHEYAAEAKFEPYFDAMADSSVFIGTDASEIWSKKEFMKFSRPYFDKGKAWSFHPINRNIYFSEDHSIIWFDELLDTWMGTCRGSGVLVYQNDSLKIKHYVLSVCVPNDDMNMIISVKSKNDSLFRVHFDPQ
ncbi:MAG: nuclear transport factor 2 family protein [Brumimicrobium sp.]|nr:nuclear transport factor 2 family protein [Brumimicrobium sp.]